MAKGKLKETVHYMSRLSEDNFHELEENIDNTVVILGMHEFVWSNKALASREFHNEYIEPFIKKYAKLPEDQRPDIKFLLSGYKYPSKKHASIQGDVTDGVKETGIPWAEIVFWPTYYFGEAVHDYYTRTNEGITDAYRLAAPPRKLFTLFQNRGTRPHRVSLMHSVHQDNFDDYGVIRYCNSQQGWEMFMHEIGQEEIKHPGEHKIHTSLFKKMTPKMHKYFSAGKWWPPGECYFDTSYLDGLIDLVSTTTCSHVMYCEKTVRPLFTGKPFLLFGAPDCNKHLKDFGFEIYDEIFDYAEDNYFSDEVYGMPWHLMKVRRRSWYYDKMLKPLFDMDKSPEAVKDLYDRTREKAKHNQEVLTKIIFDDEILPYVFNEHLPNINSYFSSVLHSRARMARDSYFMQFLTDKQKELAHLNAKLRPEVHI